MKFTSFLSATALLNGAVSAAYLKHSTRAVAAKRASTKQYRLKVKSDFDALDDLYISSKSNTLGIYDNGTQDTAIEITTSTGENADSTDDAVSLTPYPVGIVEHALGLVGTNGYLEFRDLSQPSGHTTTSGNETYSYDEFSLGDNEDDEAEGLGQRLLYKTVEPGWIASPAGEDNWKIKNYDATDGVVIIQNYIPIIIYLEEVEED